MSQQPYRVLITGSRSWTDEETISNALRTVWEEQGKPTDMILVSGHCPTGADAICERIWEKNGLTVERYPADWDTHGKAAGFVRNKTMVDSKPDICLAFRKNNSKGTTHTINLASKAGIPLRIFDS